MARHGSLSRVVSCSSLVFGMLIAATCVISFVQYTRSSHRLRLLSQQPVANISDHLTEQPHGTVKYTSSSHRHHSNQFSAQPDSERSSYLKKSPSKNGIHNHNFTAIVVLTYQRSGSSFTGDLLQQHPGSFYVYEPLREVSRHADISFLNGTSGPRDTFNQSSFVLETVENWLKCDLYNVFTWSLLDTLFLSFGSKTNQLNICNSAASKQHKKGSQAYMNVIKKCVRNLEAVCKASDVRIIKTIRIPMSLMGSLMDRMANLKIVNLLRDPRATLQSRRSAGQCRQPMGMLVCASQYCRTVRILLSQTTTGGLTRIYWLPRRAPCVTARLFGLRTVGKVQEDMKVKEKLKSKYPARIFTTFYEDIAGNPVNSSKELYKFVGMPFTPVINKYVRNITSSNRDKALCKVCNTWWQNRHTGKDGNSSSRIDKWRDIMSYENLNAIQKVCRTVMLKHGYRLIDADNMRRT